MTECVMCARAAGDGHACKGCAGIVVGQLAMCGWLAGELVVTLTRQARLAGGGGRSTAAGSPLGFHAGARLALDSMRNTLTTWARDFDTSRVTVIGPACVRVCGHRSCWSIRGLPADDPAAVAAWLAHADIRHHPAVDEFTVDLQREIEHALATINADGEQTFGVCGADTDLGPCPAYLYGDAHASFVRCKKCLAQHDTRARIAAMRSRAQVLYFRAATLARLLPLLLERPVSASNIRNWSRDGRPIRTKTDDEGNTTYCCGDVIDVAESTPRRNREARKAG